MSLDDILFSVSFTIFKISITRFTIWSIVFSGGIAFTRQQKGVDYTLLLPKRLLPQMPQNKKPPKRDNSEPRMLVVILLFLLFLIVDFNLRLNFNQCILNLQGCVISTWTNILNRSNLGMEVMHERNAHNFPLDLALNDSVMPVAWPLSADLFA